LKSNPFAFLDETQYFSKHLKTVKWSKNMGLTEMEYEFLTRFHREQTFIGKTEG
jgi:hypothetical protein